jgi:abortive infection bacteriophage resistance protein
VLQNLISVANPTRTSQYLLPIDRYSKRLGRFSVISSQINIITSFYLTYVNGISVYFYNLYTDEKHTRFESGTNFSRIIRAYNADKLLRSLLLKALESLEISIRANLSQIEQQTALLLKRMFQKGHNKYSPI